MYVVFQKINKLGYATVSVSLLLSSVSVQAATRDLEFLRKSHLFILNCLNSVLHMKPLPAVMFKYELMVSSL